jgi:hypothetical protein
MKLISKILFIFSCIFFSFGCQTIPYQPYARDVKKKPQQGGVIALKTEHREEDKSKANQMMQMNCGANKVKVLEEGEVVIGQETSAKSDTTNHEAKKPTEMGSFLGMKMLSGGNEAGSTQNATTSTTNIKEWQIQYECISQANEPTPAVKRK